VSRPKVTSCQSKQHT